MALRQTPKKVQEDFTRLTGLKSLTASPQVAEVMTPNKAAMSLATLMFPALPSKMAQPPKPKGKR